MSMADTIGAHLEAARTLRQRADGVGARGAARDHESALPVEERRAELLGWAEENEALAMRLSKGGAP